jgi:intergrase/recombinase
MSNATQKDIELAIYHLFCMQVEHQELKVELAKIIKFKAENAPDVEVPEDLKISARYELIDIFFFMFNVGIYSGININDVVNYTENNTEIGIIDSYGTANLEFAVQYLLNYIDKLPWKAWKEYRASKGA